MSNRLHLTDHESLVVRRSTADLLEVEATWLPGGSAPPEHLHPDQDELFVVLEGTIAIRLDGQEHRRHAGERIAVPRGAVHSMWNPTSTPARARWETAPALRTEQWFRQLDAAHTAGRSGLRGLAPLLREFDDVFRPAIAPRWILRPVIVLFAALGGIRRGSRTAVADGR